MLIRTKITKNLFYIFILIVVGFILTSCRESKHNIVKVDKVPSSCVEAGTDEHYKCTNCDKLFLDEKGKIEVTLEDLALEMLDHDVTEFCLEDKYCNRCEEVIEKAKVFHNDQNLDGICDDCASDVDIACHEDTNTYYVFNAEGLDFLAKEGRINYNIELLSDITLSSELTYDLDSDGVNDSNFKTIDINKNFNGNNHYIEGLIISGEKAAFIGRIEEGVTVSNLHIKNVTASGLFSSGLAIYNFGTIINCTVSGNISSTERSAGFVITNMGQVYASVNYATVYSKIYVGGIVNQVADGSSVVGCYNIGSVKTKDSVYGGIVAINSSCKVEACYNVGQLSSEEDAGWHGYIYGYGEYEGTNYYYSAGNVADISGSDLVTTGTDVDGTTVTWEVAMIEMNKALEENEVNFRYELNQGDNKDVEPLILKEVK